MRNDDTIAEKVAVDCRRLCRSPFVIPYELATWYKCTLNKRVPTRAKALLHREGGGVLSLCGD